MSDEPGHEPAPTDAELDEVRALLGASRVEGPMPAPVAARLEDVLVTLRAERVGVATASDATPAVVVPLRRRWGPRVLVAAAAVVVLGGTAYGVGRIARSTGDASTTSSSASSASSGRSSAQAVSPSTIPAVPGARQPGAVGSGLPTLRTAHFAADARRALSGELRTFAASGEAAGARQGQGDAPPAAPAPSTSPSASAETPGCPGPAVSGTRSRVVRLDGRRADLVVHRPAQGTRLVQAWSCDGRTLLASARVPVG